MTRVRRNVWELGGEWSETMLWYARGVRAMKARPLAQPTSWRFYAGIHGFNLQLWRQAGALRPNDQPPTQANLDQFWVQCQHSSWYFLPWHRGYLIAFEENVRQAVEDLHGPADWTMPYWNYFKPGQHDLPPEFRSPSWPDGNDDNPLFEPQRWGPGNDGTVFVPPEKVHLDAMGKVIFTGTSRGGEPGFGGIDTDFHHGGGPKGGIERQPHDQVHVSLGGHAPDNELHPGLMSDPAIAGLDPIFWLHHANIDRLWAAWNGTTAPPPRVNPTEPKWLAGPVSLGQRAFMMPMPGNKIYTYTPAEVTDLALLEYEYDDLTPGFTPAPVHKRLERLKLAPRAQREDRAVPDDTDVELVGATTEPIPIRGGDGVTRDLRLDAGMRRKVTRSLSPEFEAVAPDRVFLNLENIRGRSDAASFAVFVADRPAGDVAPFGMRQATETDGEGTGEGLTVVIDITDLVDDLHLADSFDVASLPVRIVPDHPVGDAVDLSIGRISIFRQGA